MAVEGLFSQPLKDTRHLKFLLGKDLFVPRPNFFQHAHLPPYIDISGIIDLRNVKQQSQQTKKEQQFILVTR